MSLSEKLTDHRIWIKLCIYIYIVILLLVLFFSFCYSYSKDKNIIILCKSLTFLSLFLPAALRLNTGTDYTGYINIYNDILHNNNVDIEIGWLILNKVGILCNFPSQYIIIISSFITYIALFFTPQKKKLGL